MGKLRAAIDRWLAEAASDHPPLWIRTLRRWSPPTWYCAFVAANGALTLLLRPFLPHATGTTYGGLRTVSEAWPLAGVLMLFIVLAAIQPKFGAFFLVMMTAMIRCFDARDPLSVVPFLFYGWLFAWKFCIFVGWQPIPWAAREWRKHHAARG